MNVKFLKWWHIITSMILCAAILIILHYTLFKEYVLITIPASWITGRMLAHFHLYKIKIYDDIR